MHELLAEELAVAADDVSWTAAMERSCARMDSEVRDAAWEERDRRLTTTVACGGRAMGRERWGD